MKTNAKTFIILSLTTLALFVSFSVPQDVFAASNVKDSAKVLVKQGSEEALEDVILKAGGKVLGRVVGAAGVVLELFWPNTAGDPFANDLCVNGGPAGKVCGDLFTPGNTFDTYNVPTGGSYTMSWIANYTDSGVRCRADSTPMSVNPMSQGIIDLFANTPAVGQQSYVPNKTWSGSLPPAGGSILYNSKANGSYVYNFMCRKAATGNSLTRIADFLSGFGQVSQPGVFGFQHSIIVSVGNGSPPPPPPPPPPPAGPSVALVANPTVINQGQSATLGWGADNVTTCTASASPSNSNWSGNITPVGGGGRTVTPTQTTTFTLSCSGSGGSASKSAQITVIPPSAPPPSGPGCVPKVDIKVQ